MNVCWSIVGASVCFAAGCAPASTETKLTEPHETARSSQHTPAAAGKATPPLAETRRPMRDVAPSLDGQFEVTRQVAALERSIELYEMFIERAGDDPRFDEAIRRSRGRIDDARLTICFLRDEPCGSAEVR